MAVSPRCVVWHTPGLQPPHTLREALVRRGLDVTTCTDPHEAMARLCIFDRDSGADGVLILLLVEPEGLDRAVEVIAAAEVYVPSTRFWMYVEEEQNQLRQVTPHDVRGWDTEPEEEPPIVETPARTPSSLAHAAAQPRLKLVGPGPAEGDVRTGAESPPLHGEISESDEEDPADPASLLSDDELNMLLTDDEENGGRV